MATLSPKATYTIERSPLAPDEEIVSANQTSSTFQDAIKRYYLGVPGVLAGVILGILIGYAVNTTNPSSELTSWIGILGTLFIRAIKCIVGPLVFCSLVVGVADMLSVGKAGLVWVLIFRPLFSSKEKIETDETPKFAFQCDQEGYFLTNVNGSITCAFDEAFNATGTHDDQAIFLANDINGYFEQTPSTYTEQDLTETLQGQLEDMVPVNITSAFADATLISIIMFAIPFGVAIAKLPRDQIVVSQFFREMNDVLMKMMTWVIACTPIALVSLLAEVVAKQDDLSLVVQDIGWFVLCVIVGILVHLYGVYPLMLRVLVTDINPFAYLKHIFPAQVFAFTCASSVATLPVTIRCVDATKSVSRTLSRFCLSLGATANMHGTAIFYPVAIVFMAETDGLGYLIGGGQYIVIILVSTLNAIAAGPVPSAAIVLTMTIWSSVFPSVALPSSFTYIIAADWLLDRFRTPANISGDAIIARIVAQWVQEDTLEEDEDKEDDDTRLDKLTHRVSSRHSNIKLSVSEPVPV